MSGKRLARTADVAALAVPVGLASERQASVHADVTHPEGARHLDEAQPTSSEREVAAAAGPYCV